MVPFFSGSHKQWALNFQIHSKHEIKIFALPGRHWKWRMHGAAISLSEQLLADSFVPDVVLTTDMMDTSTLKALLCSKYSNVPIITYFHENQLTYPWSPKDQDVQLNRNLHYGFINYTSALTSDKIIFNSSYNRDSFFKALKEMLHAYPDYRGQENVHLIKAKSKVIAPGFSAVLLDKYKLEEHLDKPLILWNHRWEFDKQPKVFSRSIEVAQTRRIKFLCSCVW